MKRRITGVALLAVAAVTGCTTPAPAAPSSTTRPPSTTAPATVVPSTTTAPAETPALSAPALTPSTAPASPSATVTGERILKGELVLSETGDPFLQGLSLLDPATQTAGSANVSAGPTRFALSPDARVVATPDDGLVLYDVATGDEEAIGEPAARAVAWRPDGRLTFLDDAGELWLVGVGGAGSERIAEFAGSDVVDVATATAFSWSPDGRYAVLAANPPANPTDSLFVFDAETKRVAPVAVPGGLEASWPAWSPTGAALAFAAGAGPTDIYVAPVAAGRVGTPEPITTSQVNEIAPVWSPDGARLAYARAAANTHDIIISAPDGSNANVLQGPDTKGVPLAWATFGGEVMPPPTSPPPAPAATGVLLLAPEHDTTTLRFTDPTGAVIREIALNVSTHHARLSPDGTQVAYLQLTEDEDGSLDVWDLYVIGADGANEPVPLTTRIGASFSWSPAGDQRIAYYDDGGVSIINADGTGHQVLAPALEISDTHWPPAWRPDGGAIAVGGSIGGQESLLLIDTRDGSTRRLVEGGRLPAWLDGERLVYQEEIEKQVNQTFVTTRRLIEIDVTRPADRRPLATGEGAMAPFVSPTGAHVAFAEFRPNGPWPLRVFERATGVVRSVPGGQHGATEFPLAWSPDGGHLAYVATDVGADGTISIGVYVSPANVSERRRLSDHVRNLSWSARP